MGAGATPVREVPNESPVFVGNITTDHGPSSAYDAEIYDTDTYMLVVPASVYTRATELFNPARVVEVLLLVQLRPDLTDKQRAPS
jgi:hypothetical protein